MEHIYILVPPQTWEVARKSRLFYEVSLSEEGFIHASEWRQLDRVANHYFPDTDQLVLVGIDTARVKPQIRWELSRSTGDMYPHIYGPLNVDAATEIEVLERGADNRFHISVTEPSFS